LAELSREDGNYAVLCPGQQIDLIFAAQPEPKDMKRDFIIMAKGYYVTDKSRASQLANASIPEELDVSQNYPNPFNPTTEIAYALPKDAWVKLTIYNILGQKVKTLVNEHRPAGQQVVHWDAKDEKGENVSSGIYFYTIQAGSYTKTKKMLLLR
jgi:hypothetical protein